MINVFLLLPMSFFTQQAGVLILAAIALLRLRGGVTVSVFSYEVFIIIWCAYQTLISFVAFNVSSLITPLTFLLLLPVVRLMETVHERKNFKRDFVIFILIFLFIAVDSFKQLITGTSVFGYTRAYGIRITGPYPFVRLDTLMFSIIGIIGIYLVFYNVSLARRIGCYILVSLSVLLMLLSATRSAVAMLVFSTLCSWICMFRVRDLVSWRAAAVVVVGVLISFLLWALYGVNEAISILIDRFVYVISALVGGNLETADNRVEVWQAVFHHFAVRPWLIIFGVGFENGREFISVEKGAHQIHLDLILTTGLIGLSLMALFMIAFYRAYIKPSRIYPPVYRLQMFLFSWFSSPFMMQNHLQDTSTVLAIFFSLTEIAILHKFLMDALRVPVITEAKLEGLRSLPQFSGRRTIPAAPYGTLVSSKIR